MLLKLTHRSRATSGTSPASQKHTYRSSPSHNHCSDFILLITLLFFILLPYCAFPNSTVLLGTFLDSYINGIIHTVYILWCLASLVQHNVFKTHLLSCVAVIDSLSLLHSIPLKEYVTICLPIIPLMDFWTVPSWGFRHSCLKYSVPVSMHFCRNSLRNGISGSQSMPTFRFVKCHQTVFQRGCTKKPLNF